MRKLRERLEYLRSSPPQEEWNDDEEDDRIGKCGMSGFVEHSGLVCIYALDFFAEQNLPIKKIFVKDNKIFKFILYYYMEDLWILLELLRWLPWHLVHLGL